jgi:hypothetical protein
MYHPSILDGVPQERGVYVLRRIVKPYSLPSRTHTVNRVAVIGMADNSGSNGMKGRLKQYLCERTDTASNNNIRNAAVARIESITHIECFSRKDIFTSRDHALAVEGILTEIFEPMFRTPKGSKSKTTPEAINLMADPEFRRNIVSMSNNPCYTIRLPNIDNLIEDLILINSKCEGTPLYGKLNLSKQLQLKEYDI